MSLQNDPLISIIVPVYNTDINLFKNCIESLAQQTYRNCEVIVVDDGSNHKNKERYETLLRKYPTVIYVYQKHSGVSASRNNGLKKSNGEYIMFVDSDDFLDIDCCEKAANAASNKTDLIYFSYTKTYSDHGSKVNPAENPYAMPVIGTSCMKLYRKSLIGGCQFDESLKISEDVEFNFRIFQRLNNAESIEEQLYHYVIRKDSSVRQFQKDYIGQYTTTINRIRADLKEYPTHGPLYHSYYDFLAISYIMIILNYIYHTHNSNTHRKQQIKQLEQIEFVHELFSNYDMLTLPFTRKIIVLLGKHKLYALIAIVMRIKQRLDK